MKKNDIINKMLVLISELEEPISELNSCFEDLSDLGIERDYSDDLEYYYKTLIGAGYLDDLKWFLKAIQ